MCKENALDSRAQRDGVMLIVSVVEQLTCLREENLNTISTQLTVSCSNLAEKADQCRGVTLCAHLFWSGKIITLEDPTEVLEVSTSFHALKIIIYVYNI